MRPRVAGVTITFESGLPFPGAGHVLSKLTRYALPAASVARVSGDIEMTSLFIFTPVMDAAMDGARKRISGRQNCVYNNQGSETWPLSCSAMG